MVLIQSSGATAGDPSFRAVTADVQRRLAALPHTQNFESPLAPANANQISADGHSALLRFQIAGNDTEVMDRVKPAIAATGRRADRRIPGSPSESSATPAPTADQRHRVQSDFGQGPGHLPADHAAHPADRLRGSRRCRGAAAPGADGRLRHDRPHRAHQPPHRRGRQLDQRGGPADRPGRRSRLLDVLSAPRARGKRGGPKRGSGTGRRGGDLRPRGDGLRFHGDHRDGRHVPRRRRPPSSRSRQARSSSSRWRWWDR